MGEVQRFTLGYAETGKEHLLCHLYAELLKKALDTPLKAYHCDLYHDAVWIGDHVQFRYAPFTFYYGVRETGTSIGTNFDSVRQMNERVFKCSVVRLSLGHSDAYKHELVMEQAFPFPAQQSAAAQ